jgi:hypothetical protein
MQRWNSGDTAPYTAREGLKQFAARGIKMPDNVNTAVATLERVTAARPVKPPVDALRKLIVNDASQAEINALLLDDIGHQRLFMEYQQAEIDAARILLREIRNAEDTLFPQLKKLAQKATTALETVAMLGDAADLATLVRDGRHDDARAVVDSETVGQELRHLYELRDNFLIAGDRRAMLVDNVDCSQWTDPRKPNHHGRGNDTIAQAYVRGLRAGGQLWYPDKSEALNAAQPIAAEVRHKAEQVARTRLEQESSASAFAL